MIYYSEEEVIRAFIKLSIPKTTYNLIMRQMRESTIKDVKRMELFNSVYAKHAENFPIKECIRRSMSAVTAFDKQFPNTCQ